MDLLERRKVLELLLWLTDKPLKTTELTAVLGADAPTELELREELNGLARELDERGAPYHLMEIAQGFQFASRPAFSQWVRRLYKEKTALRLTPSALETLSIVAYKQPLTRGEIEEIRGVDVSGVLETLLERKLVKIVGRKEALGRPLLYGTTLDFMKQFGLRSLDELPRLEELVPPEEPPVAGAEPAAEAPAPVDGVEAPSVETAAAPAPEAPHA